MAKAKDAPGLGQLLADRFELRELLIETPAGPVYRAYDRDVDETVAVLSVSDEARAAGVVEELRRQVRVARRVTHRNIARTYDLGEHEGRHFMTIEYVDGVRALDWLAEGPSVTQILDVGAQLCDGLAAAHVQGVIHCNVSPTNVMVDRSGRAVLGNFGLSRFEAAETLAQLGGGDLMLLRSATYLAPEQVLGQSPSVAVDVYALGLVIYELLTGAPRFGGDQPVLVANARLDDDLADLRAPDLRPPQISAATADALARALARQAQERCTAAELATLLRRAATESELPTATASSVTKTTSSESSWSAVGDAGVTRRYGSLAVLPFRYRGPQDSDYLGEALVDELTDLLSKNRGLRVFAAGATAGLTGAGDRDPKQLGEQLGVEVIVEGTLLLAGDRLRISARLVEVAGGFQLWHERFEGGVADVFELQDKLAKRIAEALRLELEIIAHRGEADGEAVEHYLRGRGAHLRWNMFGPQGAISHYRAALELAPGFKPALGHLALASVLAWFQPRHPDGVDWKQESERAVAEALALAPELAETQLAAANLALVQDEPRAAAIHACEALRIAPTYALAHEFLGRILLECDYPRVGVEHIELALGLDPSLAYGLADLARARVLDGDLDGFQVLAARLLEVVEHHRPATGMLYARVGAWTRDEAMIRRGIDLLSTDGPRSAGIRRFAELLLAPGVDADLQYLYIQQLAAATSPRLQTLVEQLSAEQAAYHGAAERALDHLRRAVDLGLFDIAWLDRCPVLANVREQPEFAELRARVRVRGAAIWDVVQSA